MRAAACPTSSPICWRWAANPTHEKTPRRSEGFLIVHEALGLVTLRRAVAVVASGVAVLLGLGIDRAITPRAEGNKGEGNQEAFHGVASWLSGIDRSKRRDRWIEDQKVLDIRLVP